MRGMILAGCFSTRLYPLTLEVPKPLVPVVDRPVVDHVMTYLVRQGVDELVINVHYFAAAVETHIGDGAAWGAGMAYLREPELMGSAGAVKQVESLFGSTFVVIGCDDITDVDLHAALAFHRARGAEATIVLVEAEDVSHYGVVVVDHDGRIREFQEKPAPGTARSNLVNTGIYVFEPEVLARIPAGAFYDFGKQVFPKMLADGAGFYGMQQSAYWCDIGTPSEYRRCHFDALAGKVRLRPGDGASVRGTILTGASAHVDPTARLIGPACIGAGSRVGAGASVERSILWENVVVENGAHVRDAVLADGVRVQAGATINGGEHGRNLVLT